MRVVCVAWPASVRTQALRLPRFCQVALTEVTPLSPLPCVRIAARVRRSTVSVAFPQQQDRVLEDDIVRHKPTGLSRASTEAKC